MQHKLEELCQIETVLLVETVNFSYLSQEHQVCVDLEKTLVGLFLNKCENAPCRYYVIVFCKCFIHI